MKTLLITNYWTPYNNAGTIRWWNFAKYIQLNVLTTKTTKGIIDKTMYAERSSNVKRIRTFNKISSINGICLSVVALFAKADLYVFTIPSETLLFGAYILQRMNKKVILDVRDKINRPHQPLKFMIPIYEWFYKRIDNVIVVSKVIDETKILIEHGHDYLTLKIDEPCPMPEGRFTHLEYNELLQRGFIPKNKIENYPQSGLINIRHLWGNRFSNKNIELKTYSWEEQSQKIKKCFKMASHKRRLL